MLLLREEKQWVFISQESKSNSSNPAAFLVIPGRSLQAFCRLHQSSFLTSIKCSLNPTIERLWLERICFLPMWRCWVGPKLQLENVDSYQVYFTVTIRASFKSTHAKYIQISINSITKRKILHCYFFSRDTLCTLKFDRRCTVRYK